MWTMWNGEIRLYQTSAGTVPFSEWFDRLADIRTQQRIDARLTRMRVGNFGDAKAVGGGVLELRLDFGPGYRIYFWAGRTKNCDPVMRRRQVIAEAGHQEG